MGFSLKRVGKFISNPKNWVDPIGIFGIGDGVGKDGNVVQDVIDTVSGKNAADDANKAALQAWNMQNEYNTPENQVQRLRAAGLNPNLFYSQGNTGNANSAPDTHSYNKMQFLGFLTQLANLQYLQAQTDGVEASTDARVADTMLKKATLDFFNKHGYFPNQSAANVFMSELGSAVSGFLPSAADAIGHIMGLGSLKRAQEYRDRLNPKNMTKEQRSQMSKLGYVYDVQLGDWVKFK